MINLVSLIRQWQEKGKGNLKEIKRNPKSRLKEIKRNPNSSYHHHQQKKEIYALQKI